MQAQLALLQPSLPLSPAQRTTASRDQQVDQYLAQVAQLQRQKSKETIQKARKPTPSAATTIKIYSDGQSKDSRHHAEPPSRSARLQSRLTREIEEQRVRLR